MTANAGGDEHDLSSRLAEALAEVERLKAVLNTPEVADFVAGVMLEAPHQRQRWGLEHDAGKTPTDWWRLLRWLAVKAARAEIGGDLDKARHHTISTAAVCAHWHAQLTAKIERGAA